MTAKKSKPKTKKAGPMKMWMVVDRDNIFYPELFPLKQDALHNCGVSFGDRVARVEIREI